jgi:hypothetical protein
MTERTINRVFSELNSEALESSPAFEAVTDPARDDLIETTFGHFKSQLCELIADYSEHFVNSAQLIEEISRTDLIFANNMNQERVDFAHIHGLEEKVSDKILPLLWFKYDELINNKSEIIDKEIAELGKREDLSVRELVTWLKETSFVQEAGLDDKDICNVIVNFGCIINQVDWIEEVEENGNKLGDEILDVNLTKKDLESFRDAYLDHVYVSERQVAHRAVEEFREKSSAFLYVNRYLREAITAKFPISEEN